MVPQSCPICKRPNVKSVFENVPITVDIQTELRKVGGLAAFMCTVNSHIFFVRTADLEEDAAREVPKRSPSGGG